jgi:hypothetical protein
MTPVYVEGIGVLSPGLAGWEQAHAVLRGDAPYTSTPLGALKPALLAPDVRRRTTDHIRLAVEVAGEAVRHAGRDGRDLASVFASAESDGAITHDICIEIVKERPQVSPTKFHNSVTNAAAGYWCMAVGSHRPSTSVAGWDATFSAALVETVSQLLTDQPQVLLVAHDTPMPEPLHGVRPIVAIFGTALVLTRESSPRSLARLTLAFSGAAPSETTLADPALESLRRGNPAARALPLLAALARGTAAEIHLPHCGDLGMYVQIEPCA